MVGVGVVVLFTHTALQIVAIVAVGVISQTAQKQIIRPASPPPRKNRPKVTKIVKK